MDINKKKRIDAVILWKDLSRKIQIARRELKRKSFAHYWKQLHLLTIEKKKNKQTIERCVREFKIVGLQRFQSQNFAGYLLAMKKNQSTSMRFSAGKAPEKIQNFHLK